MLDILRFIGMTLRLVGLRWRGPKYVRAVQCKRLRRLLHHADCVVDVSNVEGLELRIQPEGFNFGSHTVWVEPRLFDHREDADREPPLNQP
jgi:hypothetical protein